LPLLQSYPFRRPLVCTAKGLVHCGFATYHHHQIMSYRDPYYPPQAPQRYEQPYRDNDAYDPYYSNNTTTANYPAHPTYDQSGYRDADMDDEAYPNPSRFQEPRDTSPDATAVSGGEQKERSKYEAAGFPPALRPPKDTGAIRIWRQDFHGGMWTRGSRGRCIGRFCCCTLFLGVFLIASIVLTLLIVSAIRLLYYFQAE